MITFKLDFDKRLVLTLTLTLNPKPIIPVSNIWICVCVWLFS